jgi:deoxyribose-phosphate aldolase
VARADFVKSSSGFHGNPNIEDIRLMNSACLPLGLEVKASGGIKTLDQLNQMVESGASRIGTSSSVNIMKELYDLGGYSRCLC